MTAAVAKYLQHQHSPTSHRGISRVLQLVKQAMIQAYSLVVLH